MEFWDSEEVVAWLTDHGLTILVILIAAALAYRVLGTITRALTRRIQEMDGIENSELDKRTDTIFGVVHSTGIVLIVGTAVLTILSELGVAITPVLASVGVVGLAVGLGAQTLVQDMISGLFILIENQYTVGDVVEINEIIGPVEEMNLRVTMIRDLYGTLHMIPNGEIRTVANRSRDWSRGVLDVGITYAEDVDLAIETLQEICATLEEDEQMKESVLEPAMVTGVEDLGDWAVVLRIMVRTLPNAHWDVQRYLRRQIKLVFDQKGIDLAFPRQDVSIVNAAQITAQDNVQAQSEN